MAEAITDHIWSVHELLHCKLLTTHQPIKRRGRPRKIVCSCGYVCPRYSVELPIPEEGDMNRLFRCCPRWVALLLIPVVMWAAGCTAPVQMPVISIQADLTVVRLVVTLYRMDEMQHVALDAPVVVQERDRIELDETGRARLRFSDHLLVELFRSTEVYIENVSLEPSNLVFVRLRQAAGHTRVELESIARARLILETDYAIIRSLDSNTEFATCHAPEIVTCTVTLAGKTEVEAQGRVVTVREGQGTYIFPGQPPQPPVRLDLDEVQRWLDQIRSKEDVPDLVELVLAQIESSGPGTPTPPLIDEPAGDASDAEVWVNPADEATYMRIPAGAFTMGADADADHSPAHTVYLEEFWIMQTEVTNTQYARCVEADVCTALYNERWSDPALADHPVTGVSWNQANAYAEWVGGRLPTEAEWEKAARGTDERMYPWGNQSPGDQHANFNFMTADTMPVGSYLAGASPYGVLDMAGNVEEWVADWYANDYYAASPERTPLGPENGFLRVLRGGSFFHNPMQVRVFTRAKALPDSKFDSVGFRVAVSAPKN